MVPEVEPEHKTPAARLPSPPRDGEGGGRGKEASEAIKIGIPLVSFTLACSNEQLKKTSCCFWEVLCFFCFVQRPSQLPFSGRPFLYMLSAKVHAADNRRHETFSSKGYPLYPFFMKVTLWSSWWSPSPGTTCKPYGGSFSVQTYGLRPTLDEGPLPKLIKLPRHQSQA